MWDIFVGQWFGVWRIGLCVVTGASASLIQCKSDKMKQCAAIVNSMLPWESTSKVGMWDICVGEWFGVWRIGLCVVTGASASLIQWKI